MIAAQDNLKAGNPQQDASGRTRTYRIWMNMKQRCNNPRRKCYKDYGGRGITYDSVWESFRNFLKDMGECPEDHTLERLDNDGNYTKENCAWRTSRQQNRNRRNQRRYHFDGRYLLICEWAELTGIPEKVISERLITGWSLEDALTRQYTPRVVLQPLTKDEKLARGRAHDAIRRALRKGTITRPAACEQCSVAGPVQAHHYRGYDKSNRLTVEWLCTKCHGRTKV